MVLSMLLQAFRGHIPPRFLPLLGGIPPTHIHPTLDPGPEAVETRAPTDVGGISYHRSH